MQSNAKKLSETNLTIAHIKSSTPDYRVEDADIVGEVVRVSFYDEHGEPDAPCENTDLPVKDLLGFIEDLCLNKAYRHSYGFGGFMEEEMETPAYQYLEEHTAKVVEEFMNKGGFKP